MIFRYLYFKIRQKYWLRNRFFLAVHWVFWNRVIDLYRWRENEIFSPFPFHCFSSAVLRDWKLLEWLNKEIFSHVLPWLVFSVSPLLCHSRSLQLSRLCPALPLFVFPLERRSNRAGLPDNEIVIFPNRGRPVTHTCTKTLFTETFPFTHKLFISQSVKYKKSSMILTTCVSFHWRASTLIHAFRSPTLFFFPLVMWVDFSSLKSLGLPGRRAANSTWGGSRLAQQLLSIAFGIRTQHSCFKQTALRASQSRLLVFTYSHLLCSAHSFSSCSLCPSLSFLHSNLFSVSLFRGQMGESQCLHYIIWGTLLFLTLFSWQLITFVNSSFFFTV